VDRRRPIEQDLAIANERYRAVRKARQKRRRRRGVAAFEPLLVPRVRERLRLEPRGVVPLRPGRRDLASQQTLSSFTSWTVTDGSASKSSLPSFGRRSGKLVRARRAAPRTPAAPAFSASDCTPSAAPLLSFVLPALRSGRLPARARIDRERGTRARGRRRPRRRRRARSSCRPPAGSPSSASVTASPFFAPASCASPGPAGARPSCAPCGGTTRRARHRGHQPPASSKAPASHAVPEGRGRALVCGQRISSSSMQPAVAGVVERAAERERVDVGRPPASASGRSPLGTDSWSPVAAKPSSRRRTGRTVGRDRAAARRAVAAARALGEHAVRDVDRPVLGESRRRTSPSCRSRSRSEDHLAGEQVGAPRLPPLAFPLKVVFTTMRSRRPSRRSRRPARRIPWTCSRRRGCP
jgi:hypothetical protein